MGQYLDSHISDVQVIFLLAFLPKKFENSLHCRFAEVYRGALGGRTRVRGVPKRKGSNFSS